MSIAKKAKKEKVLYDTYVITSQNKHVEIIRVDSSLSSAKAIGAKILADCQLFDSNESSPETDEEERQRREREKQLAIFTGSLSLWLGEGSASLEREAALVPEMTRENAGFFLNLDERERIEWESMGIFYSLGSMPCAWPINRLFVLAELVGSDLKSGVAEIE
jgi:hypothetical protein